MAGYSKRLLWQKLGLKAGQTAVCLNGPPDYRLLLGELPPRLTITHTLFPNADFIHFFTLSASELGEMLPELKESLAKNGALWVSWPKKAAKIPTDLDGNLVRELGLASGLVDIKVAAVDEVWSALKFVYRLEDR